MISFLTISKSKFNIMNFLVNMIPVTNETISVRRNTYNMDSIPILYPTISIKFSEILRKSVIIEITKYFFDFNSALNNKSGILLMASPNNKSPSSVTKNFPLAEFSNFTYSAIDPENIKSIIENTSEVIPTKIKAVE